VAGPSAASAPTATHSAVSPGRSPANVAAADRRGPSAGGAADADGRVRLQPCQKHDPQDTNLSSPDPRQRNSGGRPGTPSTDESNHEDNTEEPALAGAGPDHRRGS
jgi:hypothetical protein